MIENSDETNEQGQCLIQDLVEMLDNMNDLE